MKANFVSLNYFGGFSFSKIRNKRRERTQWLILNEPFIKEL